MNIIFTYIKSYLTQFVELSLDMAPYLVMGFVIAGILHVLFPKNKISKYLGKKNIGSVIKASLFGVPLPLCSCGVIPTGVALYKNGASKASTTSFLISTPQTGVDSIFVTYSLLGLPLAIIRPIVALITGIIGGIFVNASEKKEIIKAPIKQVEETNTKKQNVFFRIFKYAFVDLLEDISKWLIIGLAIAALIAVLVPNDFFSTYMGNEYVTMLIILIAAIPLYVCATGSVPIAAVLLLKGVSPGAALVFLMAGPATNAATITVIGKVLGRNTLIKYLASIIGGALFFGIIINEFIPRDLILSGITKHSHGSHGSHLIPRSVQIISACLLLIFIIYNFAKKYFAPKNIQLQTVNANKNITTVIVNGMNCNNCKTNVETNLNIMANIKSINVDLATSKVEIEGDNIDLDEVKKTIESIGYKYGGQI